MFPGPSGFDYAAASVAASQFDYWFSFDFAVDTGVLANIAAGGCQHFVAVGSPTTPANAQVTFGLNEQGPGFNVPQFFLGVAGGYSWFGGPVPAPNTWYHVDLHVVYDNATLTTSPVLFIDGVNQNVPTGFPVGIPYPGDKVFYFGSDQFCGGGASATENTWLGNVTVGTAEGANDLADLTTAAELQTAITNGVGDNPAASLSVLTASPF